MHIDEVKRYQAEKEHMMRNEGTHPVNQHSDATLHYPKEEMERSYEP